MLRVLVVESSATARAILVDTLSNDPGFGDVRTATSGEKALSVLRIWRPDIVTMGIHLDGIDGFETTSRIMCSDPVPIVVVSGDRDADDAPTVFQTMDAGALAFLGKPPLPTHPEYERRTRELVRSIKLLARVKPLRKRFPAQSFEPPSVSSTHGLDTLRPRILAIGGSTGAPPVLKTLLKGLPNDFPGSILIVQHMSPGFTAGMARWLRDTTGFQVELAEERSVLKRGRVYLAPDRRHMGIGKDGRFAFSSAAPEHSMRPAVSFLFRSLARNQPGRVVGVLLTGMGEDGSRELKLLRDAGCTTMVQDEATSVVWGMAGKAVECGGARYVLSPERLIKQIRRRFGIPTNV